MGPIFPLPFGNWDFDDTVCSWWFECVDGGLTGGFNFPGTYCPINEPSSANWPASNSKKKQKKSFNWFSDEFNPLQISSKCLK